ncbi:MAG TPA: ABC transporter permease [bacterium]|nr:ABC transporter permease [bacterium]
MPPASPIERFGRAILGILDETGHLTLLLLGALRWVVRGRIEARQTLLQMAHIGVEALPLIIVTGAFAGMVLAYQSARQLLSLGAPGFVGGLVAVSLAREAAPVFTAVTAAGRSGAGIAAEVGTMAVTEQLDALRVMATDPVRYLVVPRLLASLFVLPVLTVFANLAGLIGGWGVAGLAGIGTSTYLSSVRRFLEVSDLSGGLVKAALFGIIIALVGSHRGLTADGGAAGVGRAATAAVVLGIVLILGGNYVLDVLLF